MAYGHVVQAQTALAAAGFYSGKIHGEFDAESLAAVKKSLDNIDKAMDMLKDTETLVSLEVEK